MNNRDRLAADLKTSYAPQYSATDGWPTGSADWEKIADRLIALGWTRDEDARGRLDLLTHVCQDILRDAGTAKWPVNLDRLRMALDELDVPDGPRHTGRTPMPRTEAGKRLLADPRMTKYPWLTDDTDAIEAEAVAAERARIRAAVEGLPLLGLTEEPVSAVGGAQAFRAAVLAILNREDTDA